MKGMLLCILLFLVPLTIVAQSQICGAPVYPGSNGSIVNCPVNTSVGGCEISLSFLKCISQKDPAIRVNPGDLVTWYTDLQDADGKFYKFRFNKFKELKKSDHNECEDPEVDDGEPFPNLSAEGHKIFHEAYVDDGATPGKCFKEDIVLLDSHQHESPLDPHVIIGDGTLYYLREIFEIPKLTKPQANKATKPQSKKPPKPRSN